MSREAANFFLGLYEVTSVQVAQEGCISGNQPSTLIDIFNGSYLGGGPDLRDRPSLLLYDWLWEDVLTVSLLACPDHATCLAKLEQVRTGDFTGTGGRLVEDYCRSHSPDSLYQMALSAGQQEAGASCPHPYIEDHILKRILGGITLEMLRRPLPVEIPVGCSIAEVEVLDSYHEITCEHYWRIDADLRQHIAPADPLPRFP